VGRKWQVELFSLFRSPGDALDLLQAEVVAEEKIVYDGQSTRAKRIEYRNLSAAGVASEHTLRAVVWVADDGTVLRQDVFLMNTRLQFTRRTDPDMIQLARDILDLETVATLTTPRATP